MQLHHTYTFNGTKSVKALIPLDVSNSNTAYGYNVFCYPERKCKPVKFYTYSYIKEIRVTDYGYRQTTREIAYELTQNKP